MDFLFLLVENIQESNTGSIGKLSNQQNKGL